MTNETQKLCVNHTDRPAAGKCIACFKPVCADCMVSHGGQDYCSRECVENSLKTAKRLEELNAADRRIRRKRLLKKIIFLLILGAAAYAAYHFVDRDRELQGKIKEKLNEGRSGAQ